MLINLTTDKLTFPSGGEGGRDGVTAAIMDTKRTTAVRVRPVDICKTTCEYFQCFFMWRPEADVCDWNSICDDGDQHRYFKPNCDVF